MSDLSAVTDQLKVIAETMQKGASQSTCAQGHDYSQASGKIEHVAFCKKCGSVIQLGQSASGPVGFQGKP